MLTLHAQVNIYFFLENQEAAVPP